MTNTSDLDLVERTLAGEMDAFEQLVARYEGRIHVLAAHSGIDDSSIDDVVQDTFIQAFRKLDGLRDRSHFGSWIYKIAMRYSWEKRAKQDRSTVPVDESCGSSAAGPERAAESAESRGLVHEAVASLPDHYRLPVMLRFFENMNCDEIAEHLDEPPGTIRTRLHRANGILREKLGFMAANASGGAR